MSFSKMKNSRTDLNKLVEAATASNGQSGNSNDDRFWYPNRDKAGNGYAVIRFLPSLNETGTPWVRYWEHAFKGPTGQWYIEKSLTSIGQQDPIAELNGKMWNSGIESDKAVVRQRKRNLRYVTNALIISDPANPENEGKVKLFRFGKKIFDKIMDVMQPKFPDETPINPFDMWEGADFVIKVRTVENYPNFDTSSFKSSKALFDGNDEKLEEIYNKQYDLNEWIDPKNYKSYDELKTRLNLVLGETAPRTTKQEISIDKREEPPTMATAESISIEDDDDTVSYFARIANQD
jgi:hypothetical protein